MNMSLRTAQNLKRVFPGISIRRFSEASRTSGPVGYHRVLNANATPTWALREVFLPSVSSGPYPSSSTAATRWTPFSVWPESEKRPAATDGGRCTPVRGTDYSSYTIAFSNMELTEEPGGRAASANAAAQGPSTQEQWEQTLAELHSMNEDLQKRKADAEKDRDLFRDLYSRASLHASEVSKENNELTERATLAETQAHDGVAMVKATYEERLRLLEQEVERWKGQVHVLTERDRRMDDELRRRAALEPELRRENARLREQLIALEEDYRRVEGTLEDFTREDAVETSGMEETAKTLIPA